MNTEIHAYIDESVKPMRDFRTLRPREERHYVIAAVTLLDVDLSNLRRDLRALRDDLHGPVHYSEMTHSKRLHALEAASGFKDWDGFIFETSHPNERTERHVRDKLLRVALLDLVREQGVSKVTIESRNINRDEHVDRVNYGLDRHDAATLTSLRSRKILKEEFLIVHATKDEEILWLADLLASSRTDALCHPKKHGYFAHIAHRIHEIERVRI